MDIEKGEARDLTQHDFSERGSGFYKPLHLNEFDLNVVRSLEKRPHDLWSQIVEFCAFRLEFRDGRLEVFYSETITTNPSLGCKLVESPAWIAAGIFYLHIS